MKVAVTGVTGCVRRYVVRHRARAGHRLRCWCRPGSDRGGFEDVAGPSLNGHDRYVSEEQGLKSCG